MGYNFKNLLKQLKNRIPSWEKGTDELAVNRKNLMVSNNFASVINNLIGGNFLTGLLLLLNADDNFMGFVTMAGMLGNLLQLFSPLILEKYYSRKKLLVIGRSIVYLFNIVIAGIVPFMPFNYGMKLMLIITVILIINILNSVVNPGIAVWHIKSLPDHTRARYFSSFAMINGILTYVAVFAASRLVDWLKASGNELYGLTIIRVFALLLCLFDLYFILKIKEYPDPRAEVGLNFFNLVLNPMKEKKYMMSVFMACIWSFAGNIPGPYFSIYLLKDLNVSYSFINGINMINIPITILLFPLWRRRIDSTSWLKTFYIAISLFLINYIGLAFVTKGTIALYPVFVIYSFLISPAISMVCQNMPFMNLPEKNRTNCMGFFSAVNSLAGLFGVLVGKEFIKYTEGTNITVFGIDMQNKQMILFLTAAVMALVAVIVYSAQKKLEQIPENAALDA